MTTAKEAYADLVKVFARLHKFEHALSIISWDELANMPPGGAKARAGSKAELKLLTHEIICSSETKAKLETVAADISQLDQAEQANFREMQRAYRSATKLPADHVQRASLAASKAQASWAANRAKNDWDAFLPSLKEMVEVSKAEGKLLAEGTDFSPYEALMDKWEPGLRLGQMNAVFDDLKSFLPGLLKEVLAKQASVTTPQGPFDLKAQEALGKEIMKDLLKFNFDAGMLSVSKHPFCGGVPEDIRLTTRYSEDDFAKSLCATIHETGHASYEQNRPRDVIDQPVSKARGFGIHESQSLFFEMQIGRSKPFQEQLVPLLKKHFPATPNGDACFTPENMYHVQTTASPGLIRIEADEITYPLHVIIRHEIEVALIEGDLPVEDIPKLWNAKMKEYLGLDTEGDFKDGPMQDMHWSVGYLGFFPTYTFGALLAAQWMAAVKKALGEEVVVKAIAEGKMEPIFDWLRTNVWHKGSSFPTAEDTLKAATGEGLNTTYFKEHLKARYVDKKW